MRTRVNPLPGVAAGSGPFVVVHCAPTEGGRSAEPSREDAGLFVAPLHADSTQALAIRQHEYGHLGLLKRGIVPRHTLRALADEGLHTYWVQGALDVVVNAYMLAQGNCEIARLTLWAGDPPTERWLNAMNYLRCEGLAVAHDARPMLAETHAFGGAELALLQRSATTLWRLGRDARRISVNQLARLIGELQHTFGPPPGDESRAAPPATPTPSATREAAPSTAETPVNQPRDRPLVPEADRSEMLRRLVALLAEAARETADEKEDAGKIVVRARAARHHGGERPNRKSGAMAILRPPLPRCSTSNRLVRRIGPGYSGAFRYPHRALPPVADGRAFGSRRHVAGGTVMVDCSGSMELSHDDVASMLAAAPAATVALYASLPSSLRKGRLVIVASRGRLAELDTMDDWFGPGNVVDIPALEWLCREKGPRVWISDGHVTGVGDQSSASLMRQAAALVQRGRVQQFASVEEYRGDLLKRAHSLCPTPSAESVLEQS